MERRGVVGYLLIAPLLVLMGAVILYPVGYSFRLAFQDAAFGFGPMRYVGWRNFQRLAADDVFWQALSNSFLWTLGNLLLQLTIPMAVAILLNQRFRGNALARTVILTPWIIPAVVVAIMWRWILEPTVGILNEVLFRLGVIGQPILFLGSVSYALPTLISVNTWKFLPFGTLLILAALQTIPDELYEATRVDGATPVQQFRYLIFPALGPMLWFLGFLAFVWNFNMFDLIWLMTEGGPGNSTMTLAVLIYKKAFRMLQMGQAAAIAMSVTVLLVLIGVLYFRLLSPREEEQA